MQQSLVFPYGEPQISALLKSMPEDFKVVEELGFSPQGEGEHLLLYIEKCGITTHELVDRVASDFNTSVKNISYSGLKDRQALTRQWLSLQLPGKQAQMQMPEVEEYRILDHGWHNRKLRRGTHRFNHFEVLLREVEGFPAATRQQLQSIAQHGFANYFGEQRFGRRQDNVEQALKQLSGRKLGRNKKGLYLSALRSFLFNQVVAERSRRGHWQQPMQGDVFMLDGSHSIFSEGLDEILLQRFHSQDIHSTASLYGSGQSPLTGEALELEEGVFSEYPEICQCLQRQGVKRQMRATRVGLEEFSYQFDAQAKTLLLQLRLPAGCYLTSLLDHFVATRQA